MAGLNFEKIITLDSKYNSLFIGNEPANELYRYYISDDRQADISAQVTLSDYDHLIFGLEARHLTSQKIKRLGIKTFPGLGAYGLYMLHGEDRGGILIPIHNSTVKYDKPALVATLSSDGVHCTITPPDNISYVCYRIVLDIDPIAYEYITYEKSFVCPLPAESGTYDIYCVGYVNEGEAVSFDSNHISMNIVGTGEAPDKLTYYTKEQVDALLGDIGTLLDRLNGVVI